MKRNRLLSPHTAHPTHARARISALLLVFALLLSAVALTSCSVTKKNTLMTLGKTSVTVNTYELLLSRLKGNMAWSVSQAGQSVDSDAFWDTVIDLEGTTLNEYYSDAVLATLKEYLIALYLFDEEYGLKLSSDVTSAIDETIDELIDYDGNGSKTTLNKILSEYGVNVEMLKEVYRMEAKYDALRVHLYGEGGSLIADTVKDGYVREKFVACKQIFIANYRATGETDENGYPTYEDLSGDALAEAEDKAAAAYEKAETADEAGFEALIGEYSDRKSGLIFLRPDASYGSNSSSAYLDEIAKALTEMETGDVAFFKSPDGWHVIRKYDVPEGAASDKANADWFESEDYSLSDELITRLFHEKCAAYVDQVKTYDAVLAAAPDMKSAATNFYY